MKNPKSFFSFHILLFALLFSCSTIDKKQPLISLKDSLQSGFIELHAEFKDYKTYENQKAIILRASLINHSVNQVYYLNFNCSWEKAFLTNNKNLFIVKNLCFQNWYYKIPIAPNGTDEKELLLIIDSTMTYSNSSFRIGFHFLPIFENDNLSERVENLYKASNIIWSNTINIPMQ